MPLSFVLMGKAEVEVAETSFVSLGSLSSPTPLFQVVAAVVLELLHSFLLPPDFSRTRKIFYHLSVADKINQIIYIPNNLLLFLLHACSLTHSVHSTVFYLVCLYRNVLDLLCCSIVQPKKLSEITSRKVLQEWIMCFEALCTALHAWLRRL